MITRSPGSRAEAQLYEKCSLKNYYTCGAGKARAFTRQLESSQSFPFVNQGFDDEKKMGSDKPPIYFSLNIVGERERERDSIVSLPITTT